MAKMAISVVYDREITGFERLESVGQGSEGQHHCLTITFCSAFPGLWARFPLGDNINTGIFRAL